MVGGARKMVRIEEKSEHLMAELTER